MTWTCLICLNFCVAVEELRRLDQDVSTAVGQAWAPNTLKCRNSQWSKYIHFCVDMGFSALPAEGSTVARFLVFLARTCKYSTINNYVSAINGLHKFYGHDIDFRKYYLIQLVLKGLKRQLGTVVEQAQPFTKDQLLKMYFTIDLTSRLDSVLWSALIFSFRTLLRKSNVVPDKQQDYGHIVRRGDVVFTDWGMMVHVRSSKTVQHRQYVLEIPVYYVNDKVFCAASALEHHFKQMPGHDDSPLFLHPDMDRPILYGDLLSFIKRLSSAIGMSGRVGCHSLRRSGAAFLHSIGTPLEDIMSVGDWRSMAVLAYLATPMDRKKEIQFKVAAKLF